MTGWPWDGVRHKVFILKILGVTTKKVKCIFSKPVEENNRMRKNSIILEEGKEGERRHTEKVRQIENKNPMI